MPKNYPNFYETCKEANMRLRGTVVLYAGEPYYVLGIADHKNDGIFRIYLDPLNVRNVTKSGLAMPSFNGDYTSYGQSMDVFIEANPSLGIIRKNMDSPLFNKYRPFPLGMVFSPVHKACVYIERHPTRKSEQGLTENMLVKDLVSLSSSLSSSGQSCNVHLVSAEMYNCITGAHPRYEEVLTGLKTNRVKSLPFHRYFAVVNGPVDVLYLAYKRDIVGVIDDLNPYSVKLDSKFSYIKEVLQELGIFTNITL